MLFKAGRRWTKKSMVVVLVVRPVLVTLAVLLASIALRKPTLVNKGVFSSLVNLLFDLKKTCPKSAG